jgi:hypothetical protein
MVSDLLAQFPHNQLVRCATVEKLILIAKDCEDADCNLAAKYAMKNIK